MQKQKKSIFGAGSGSVSLFLVLIACVGLIGVAGYVLININGNGEAGGSGNNVPLGDESPKAKATTVETLRLMIWEGHAPQYFIDSFESKIFKKYKKVVKIHTTNPSGPDDFYNMIRGGDVDVVMMGHHYFRDERYNYIKNELIMPLDLENIPNFTNVIPTLQKSDYLYSDGAVYATPVSQGPYGLAYNTTILNEPPKSWNIFWDPRYKGKYVIGASEYTFNANITALALGYSRELISDLSMLNNKEFKKKLRQLAVNAHSFWIGVDKPEILLGKTIATSWGDSLGPLKKKGEIWKIAEPTEGTPCWIDNYAITRALKKKPVMKKIAEEYINELLSVDYQVNHIMRAMSLTPIITNIESELKDVEKKVIHLGVPNFFNEKRILQGTFTERDRNGLKLLWDEAMKGIPMKNP